MSVEERDVLTVTQKMAGARESFANKDVESMKRLHQSRVAIETHPRGGDFVKSMVYGGLDGIVTTFSIICGIVGSGGNMHGVLAIVISNTIADAMAMGLGDYLSQRSEIQYAKAERRREKWETENYLEGEVREMEELYMQRGMTEKDAKRVVELLCKNQDCFIDAMMVDELQLLGWDDPDPWRNGIVTFLSFCVFGFVPISVYFLSFFIHGLHNFQVGLDWTFYTAAGTVFLTLFLLGSFSSRWSTEPFYFVGLFTLLNGGFAAVASFSIAYGLSYAFQTVVSP